MTAVQPLVTLLLVGMNSLTCTARQYLGTMNEIFSWLYSFGSISMLSFSLVILCWTFQGNSAVPG